MDDDHLLAFPAEFAKRVAELHAVNTRRTGKISCPEIPDNLPAAKECSAVQSGEPVHE